MDEPIWQPSAERVAATNLSAFMRHAHERYGIELRDYDAVWRWSVERREEFWPAVWTFCEVVSSQPWDTVLEDGDQMPGARWFRGARLNFAENLLRFRDERPAIIFWNENGRQRVLSFAELHDEVAQLAAGLQALGLEPGMRVAAFIPNMPETIILMLAVASLGGVFSSCSPDFGVPGAVDRFGQIEPVILATADGYRYAGRTHDSLERVRGIVAEIPSIRHTIVIPYLAERPALDNLPGALHYRDVLQSSGGSIPFAQLPFDHPLYILFSSGTTGAPKCIVHGAGGTLLQHRKEQSLHVDLKRDDRLFYFTTCGWMMWNWLASGLAAGAALALYDGSPFHPHGGILFDLADAEAITIFGTSAKFISAIEKQNLTPRIAHRLDSVRTIVSTGSPLVGENFDYVYRDVKQDVALTSISGGTDIVSSFALSNPLGPIWRGEIQARGLGMNVAVFDDDGRPLLGEKGELVCTSAFPSMPIGFWNDPDGTRYHAAYFERYPNVWHHGDYAEITAHGGLVIYGRSDAVLNPGGVRIGTAEIYRQVEQLTEVIESLVIGQQWESDVRIVLFVKLREGLALDETLVARIKQHIRAGTTPRHVPAKIIQVADIPRTKSGKIVELAVRNVVHRRPVTNLHALANPAALDLYRDLPELDR